MTLAALCDLLRCDVLTGVERLDLEVDTAVASDGMSVILTAPCPRALMITGLTHIQSVRTATVADSAAVLYVRANRPNEQAVALARSKGIVLLTTGYGMFDACGILRNHGMKGAI